MSDENDSANYTVGYRRPSKAKQFQKGVSGNPSGRPKRNADLFGDLIKEANAPITINDNGRPTRIPKAQGIAKQLTNKALQGNLPAMRIFLALYPQAQEMLAQATAEKAKEMERRQDVTQLSDQELMEFIMDGQDFKDWKKKKEQAQREGTWTGYSTCTCCFTEFSFRKED